MPSAAFEAGIEGIGHRIQAGTSPLSGKLDALLNDPAQRDGVMANILEMLKRDVAERERTGETPEEQMIREKKEWAAADAKSAQLKILGNAAFQRADLVQRSLRHIQRLQITIRP